VFDHFGGDDGIERLLIQQEFRWIILNAKPLEEDLGVGFLGYINTLPVILNASNFIAIRRELRAERPIASP